jgi:hypothetical protein
MCSFYIQSNFEIGITPQKNPKLAHSGTQVHEAMTPTYLTMLRNKIRFLQTKLLRCQKALAKVKTERTTYKAQLKQRAPVCNCHTLTPDQQEFVKSQVKATSRSKNGMRWSWTQKSDAMSLYFKSPSTYKLLAKKWRYPHKNTLLKLVRPLYKEVDLL